jgi:hypothetical protein
MKKTYKKLVAAMIMTMAASAFFFISCNKEDVNPDTPNLAVDQTTINAPATGGELTLTVTANRPWKLTDNTTDDKWIIADKTSGDGDAVITLTVAPNAGVTRETDIRIATSTVYADVRITQPGAVATEVIYTDDFGTGASNASGSWPSVTDWTAWNKSGAGAANVTYGTEGGAVSVRSNATSSGYTDASGGNNVMMAAAGASFLINNINPVGMTNMTLSFGVNVSNSILKVYWKTGNDWTEAPFEKTSESWELKTVNFDIPEGSTVLHLKFTANTTQYGSRVDDVKLTGAGGSGAPTGDLSVSPTSLNFAAGGEAKSFTVTSTKSWTVTSSGTWCTFSPTSGSNSATINVTAAANTGAQRTTTITVTTTSENPESKTVNVTQAGADSGNDGSKEHPYTISEAKTHQGSTDNTDYKWVKGYIVGVVETENSTNTANFAGPYTNQTNLLLAATSGETSWDNCLSVQLPTETKAPGIRAALNLNQHADNKGKEVLLEGTLEAYFTKAGLKNTRAYEWVSATGSTLNLTPTSQAFTDAGGTQDVAITSNTAWTITPEAAATWCTVTSSLTGSNNGTLTVNVIANTGAARTATITVKTNDNAVTRTFTVTQAAPETPQAQLSENWESGTAGTGQSAAINGWTFAKVQGDDDKKFELREFNGNKYAYASVHNGSAANYELWLISPALDITNAASKTASFKTVGGYFQSTSSLEVYVLNSKSAGTTNGTKLTAEIAESTDIPSGGTYTDWIFSGDIDLSSFSGVKYIGFRYVAEGGASKSTTYEIDDFLFGATAPKELKVNTESLSFAAGGETKPFTITSNTAWTVTSNESWCTVSSADGSNDATINVTATANTGAARAATITVSGTGVTGSKTIAVTQAGASSGGTEAFNAAWNMTGIQWGAETMAVTSNTNSNVTIGALTKTGFTSSGSSGNNNWGGNDFSGNTESNKLSAPVKYATFTISSTGAVSLSAIELIIRLTGTGPLGTSIQYQIGSGNFEEAHAITFTKPSNTTTFPKETVDLSSITALQNVAAGTTITIRIVPYIISSQTGTITGNWYLNSANASTNALTISGN